MRSLLSSDAGALSARTDRGWTPLHVAGAENAAEIAALLLDQGADPMARTDRGETPLRLALDAGATGTVSVLIEKTQVAYTDESLGGPSAAADPARLLRASDLLISLLRANPTSEKLNFAIGVVSLSLNEIGRAQMAFERVLAANAGNDRARFELARTLMAGGQWQAARAELDAVLAHNPPPGVAQQAAAFQKEITRRSRRWRVSGRADGGWLRDDNVNVGPDSETVPIAPLVIGSQILTNLTVGDGSRPIESQGGFAAAALSGVYDVGAPEGWVLTGDARYYENWLGGDGGDFESVYVQAAAGARRGWSRSLMQGTLEYAHVQIGGSSLADLYSFRPGYVRVCGAARNIAWITPMLVEMRDYKDLNDRDGIYASVGESVRYAPGGGRHTLTAGVLVFHDFASATPYAYSGMTMKLGAEAGLGRRVKLYTFGNYTWADYLDREPLAPEDRSDREWQVTAGLSVNILPHWGVEAQHQYTVNDSTFELYQFERNATTVSTWVSF